MHPSEIEIGRSVRISAPLRFDALVTGTIIQIRRDPEGLPLSVRVQLDACGELLWLHRASLRPLQEVTHGR